MEFGSMEFGSTFGPSAIQSGCTSAASPNQVASPPTSDSNPVTKCRYTAEIKVEQLNCSWEIKNFSFCKEGVGESLDLPPFCVGAQKETTWRLQVYPKGKDEASKGHLSVLLALVCSSMDEVRIKFKLLIKTPDGRNLCQPGLNAGVCAFTPGMSLGYPKLMPLGHILNEKNGILQDDKLTILCVGTVAMDSVVVSGYSSRLPVQIPDCTLAENFGSLFENREFSDLVLSVDGEELRVHKAVLVARSPVFAAMFQHDMLENQQNKVAIEDVGYEVLKELLVYIYTDKSPNIEKMANDLLVAADRYDLDGLKAMCEAVLCSTLVVDNAAALLEFADKYRAKQLKAQALYFINTYIKSVMTTQAWKDVILKNPQLIVDEFGS